MTTKKAKRKNEPPPSTIDKVNRTLLFPLRQKARTDLLYLCNSVLGYRDVSRDIHGPIIDRLQKFQGGIDKEQGDGRYFYIPAVVMPALKGSRRNLFLDPRGHLKTTLITIAHTVQWIINYPDVRILISTATGEQAINIMRAIKSHFQFNDAFRALFPEFCPPAARAADFGSQDQFIIPCRRLKWLKEPTVWTCSVGKVIAGVHPDVIKNSDLVDKENVKTPGAINAVISHFKFLNPLIERYNATEDYEASTGWNDVEGTRYDYGDLYGTLIKANQEAVAAKRDPIWQVHLRGAFIDTACKQPLWPARFSVDELEKSRIEMGDWDFSAQFMNKCIPATDGLCDPKEVQFMPFEVIAAIMPRLRLHCTIDLAGMENTRSGDWTVLTVGGFDRDGRLYVVEIRCGHYSPEEVIAHIFDLHRRYPALIDFKIEKEAHARVLLPFLKREMSKRNRYPAIYEIKRDTHTAKQHRIRGLRPWFKNGSIRFSDGIPLHVKQELMDEITQFPSQSYGVHDDILDTLADLMQDQEGGVTADVIADMEGPRIGDPKYPDRFLGFDDSGKAMWLFDESRMDTNSGWMYPERQPMVKAPTGFLD